LKKWHGRFPREKFDPEKWEKYHGDFVRLALKKNVEKS
jgi:hypothetical protein